MTKWVCLKKTSQFRNHVHAELESTVTSNAQPNFFSVCDGLNRVLGSKHCLVLCHLGPVLATSNSLFTRTWTCILSLFQYFRPHSFLWKHFSFCSIRFCVDQYLCTPLSCAVSLWWRDWFYLLKQRDLELSLLLALLKALARENTFNPMDR